MFKFLWLRRFVRARTKPIPISTAEVWERRLALIYFFCAWNILFYTGYRYYKTDNMGAIDDETLAEKLIRKSQMKNVQHYKINNLHYEGKEIINSDVLEERRRKKMDEHNKIKDDETLESI